MNFVKDNETDDSNRAKLWDIQDQKIEAHGKKIVDVMFHGQTNEAPIPASIKVDVARNDASMGRLLRAGFDWHFTSRADTCWKENGGQNTTISEDRFHFTVSMLKCYLHLEKSPTVKPQLMRGSLPSLRRADDWRKVAEWRWQV